VSWFDNYTRLPQLGCPGSSASSDDLGAAGTHSAGRAVLLVATLDCLHTNPRALWAYLDHPKVAHPNFHAVDLPDTGAVLDRIVAGITRMHAIHHSAARARRASAARRPPAALARAALR
jgi:hypothetical protein